MNFIMHIFLYSRCFRVSIFWIICIGGVALGQPVQNKSAQPHKPEYADSLLAVCIQTMECHPDKAIQLANQALASGILQKDTLLMARSQFYLGRSSQFLHHLNGIEKARLHLYAGLKLFRLLKDKRYECQSLREIGNTYFNRDEDDKAMDFYIQALAIAKANMFIPELVTINRVIGGVYDDQKQYDKAIALTKECLAINTDKSIEATLLYNLSLMYMHKNMVDEAFKVNLQHTSLCEELKDTLCLINSKTRQANIYLTKGNYEKARQLLVEVLQLTEKAGTAADRTKAYYYLGNAYEQKKDYARSIMYLKQALKLAIENDYVRTNWIHQDLARMYEQTGNFKEAYFHFTQYKKLDDSTNTIANKKQVDYLLVKYETTQKEQKIKLLQKEKQLQHLKLQQQTDKLNRQAWIQRIILLVALLVLAFLSILWILYRQRMQSKLLLAAQTEQVNRQQTLELIREHELKTIRANLEGRDKERVRIARELHDGVAGTVAGMKLQLANVASEHHSGPVLEKVIHNLDSVYHEIRTISHNLNPPKVLDTAFIDLLSQQLAQQAEGAGLEVDFICHPEEDLNQLPDTLKIEIYRILQELITNTIKHARANSVEVQFTHRGDSVNLLFEDNGIGFDTSRVSPGIGLSNISSRVSKLSGIQYIESTLGRGAIVNIDIPIPPVDQTHSLGAR